MDRPAVPRATAIRASAIVVLLAVAAHGRSLRNDFVSFDDKRYVYDNAMVQRGLTADGARWAFQLEHENDTYFHPLTWLSLMTDREVFGAGPRGFHAVNVGLHAAAAVLLLWVLLAATGESAPSMLAASLFAVHPVGVEAVAWAAERKTVLSTALGFAAILVYVLARERPGWRRIAAVCTLQAASLLAKPGLVVLPGLLLVLDVWPLGRLRGKIGAERRAAALRLAVEKAPMVGVSLAGFALVAASLRQIQALHSERFPPGLRLANAAATVPRYLLDAFWPANLSVFHPFPAAVPAGAVAAGLAAILAVTAAAVALAGRAPALAAGWAWFCVALLPYLGLTSAGLWPARADRFAYVPLAGLAMAVAFGARLTWDRTAAARAKHVAAAAAIAALCWTAIAQERHWQDSIALYTRAVEVEPASAAMHFDLGLALVEAGRLPEARPEFVQAIRLDPKLPHPRVLLGSILALDGRSAEAEAQYREAIRLDPRDWDAMMLLAELLRRSGRHEEARPLYAKVAELAPRDQAAVRAQAAWFARQ